MTKILDAIRGPADLKSLSSDQLPQLASEIRDRIILATSKNGGHVGPNLGVVELTIALHRVFQSPRDPFVFDVSHQGYVHKLLTGRNDEPFDSIRTSGGYCGFLARNESPHDAFGAGHAGTALSAALGMAAARDLKGGNEQVVAILGDAALTCGITLEALNNVVQSTKKMVVVLNDNKWSIAKNVGAIAHYLSELITNPAYKRLHDDMEAMLKRLPGGDSILRLGGKVKHETKDFFVQSSLFEKFGLRYLGPIDGHDLNALHKYLEFARENEGPVLLHIITEKGKGFEAATQQPEKFHGLSPFDPESGKSIPSNGPPPPPSWQNIFGEHLGKMGKQDPSIIGITAAMPSGTGLNLFKEACPKQFFDVGIAEEHAVVFAAGMATQGLKPVCAIYSTFLQRAYDPIIHDVCLQNLPVVFAMDRAGLSPNDGPTHHGLFDLAYLRCVPNAVIMQPKDENEQVAMLKAAVQHNGPAFLRWPRGSALGVEIQEPSPEIPIGKAETLRSGDSIALWALGNMVQDALDLAAELEEKHGILATVINARFVKPLDTALLVKHAMQFRLIVTLEDHVKAGGFGSAVGEVLSSLPDASKLLMIGWPDQFIDHGSSADELRKKHHLDHDSMIGQILRLIPHQNLPSYPTAPLREQSPQ